MSYAVDCLASPLQFYDSLFEDHKSSASERFVCELLANLENNYSKIPRLNGTSIESIPDGHFVCIYGMIQDMFNTELYVDEFTDVATGTRHSFKYRDFPSLEFDAEENPEHVKFDERQSFYIVPIPGESTWVREARTEGLEFATSSQLSTRKRVITDSDVSVLSKRVKNDVGNGAINASEQKSSKQFPLTEEEQDESKTGFLVRVYGTALINTLKLNEMVRVFGILQHARLGSGFDQNDCAPDAKGPQPIPHLHAVIVQYLKHNNPYLGLICPTLSSWLSSKSTQVHDFRTRLLTWLTEAFCGDHLAAEYTLLHLLSPCCPDSKENTLTSATFSSRLPAVNIIVPTTPPVDGAQSDPEIGIQLCNRIQNLMLQLVPQLATVEVTLDSLNRGPVLTPVRDAEKGVLNTSRLQLPDGTQLLVNETKMSSGRLDALGVLNLRALTMLAVERRVPYDFQFYHLDWDTHVRVLIISTGASLIKPTLSVPWLAKLTGSLVLSSDENELLEVRELLTVASLSNEAYTMEDGLEEIINSDFVNWRRDKATYIEATEFAEMLCLLRLFCLSHGKQISSLDDWRYVCSLESARKSRLKMQNPPQ